MKIAVRKKRAQSVLVVILTTVILFVVGFVFWISTTCPCGESEMRRIKGWQNFVIPKVLKDAPESGDIKYSCRYDYIGFYSKDIEIAIERINGLKQDNIEYFKANGYMFTESEDYSGDLYCKGELLARDCFEIYTYESEGKTFLSITLYDR